MDDIRTTYAAYLRRCNEHRFDELAEFVSEHVNGPDEGLAGYVAGLEAVVEGFPDYHWELHELLVDGDRMAARLTGTGTHTGTFRGVAATGRTVRTQELAVYHTEAGRIVRCWGDLGTTVRDALVSGGRSGGEPPATGEQTEG